MHFIDLQNDIAAQVGALTMHCQDNHEAEYLRRLFLLRQRAQAHEVKADRTGTGRHSIFGGYIRHDTGHYGPAFYQTKKVHVPSILGELRWMLSGSSSVKPLQAEGIRIWNEWADANGNLGPIYGHAWRQTGGEYTPRQPVPKLPDGVEATYLGIANGQGGQGHPLKKTWEGMLARCYDKNSPSYETYGGRGVYVCNRWLQFTAFAQDAENLQGWELKQANPEPFAVQLDKDIFGDGRSYGPDQCAWVSAQENAAAANPSRVIVLEKDGVQFRFNNISEFCRKHGISSANMSDLWTGNKNAKLRNGFKLVEVIDLEAKPQPIDQIYTMLQIALERPADSGNLVSAWNVAELGQMALRPCHTLWQICIQDGKLDLMLYQRSADWFLGVPFNAAFYTTLQSMLAKMLGLKPGVFHHYFGDTHLYANQLDVADEHLCRLVEKHNGRFICPLAGGPGPSGTPHPEALQLEFHILPDLKALGKVPASPWLLRDLQIDDIQLLNYSPAPAIVAPRAAV